MGFIDDVRDNTLKIGRPCTIALTAATDPELVTDIDTANALRLTDQSISFASISRALRKNGVDNISASTLQHHYSGSCKCPTS